jgi:hypothetical protein
MKPELKKRKREICGKNLKLQMHFNLKYPFDARSNEE